MSFILTSLKLVVVDILGSIGHFPFWWYTKGFKMATIFVFGKISDAEKALAIRIQLRYLFKPMYADYTKSGRAISVVMRLIVLGFKSVIMAVALVFWLIVLVIWITLPPTAIYFIVINLTA